MTAIADEGHQRCWETHKKQGIIYLPQSTLAEVVYLLTREAGNRFTASFILNLPKTKYRVEPLTDEDLRRSAQLLNQYADSRVDFVDASIAAIAERMNVTQILTLDQRDFHIIRPRHCAYFTLLP